ncbi:MAG: sodium:proton antiporter, partial [Alistipes sp.]|nr:sodium:proton antiporter [Alistipes sp.]
APTSAGILFTMLAALKLNETWMYRKIQVLAIFDDLDTIILMIPLQIMMIGMRWQLFAIVLIVFLLLWLGWKKLDTYEMPQGWYSILFYAIVIFGLTHGIYLATTHLFGEDGGIHIEVLLPAFVWGMILKTKHSESKHEHRAADTISILFMFLVGLSMPLFIGLDSSTLADADSITASQPMMSWGEIALHVLAVSLLSNIGKLFPMFFYRDHKLIERLALSIGMFTRGEVGAGVIFIALGYNLGGPALIISVLTLVLNLILTGIFVIWVKKLALKAYGK